MRTVFEIVLGILATVLKACLHAAASAAGIVGLLTAVALLGVYLHRRIARSRARAKLAEVVSINR